jgi:predicted  nucleic acid-binding Zn-ribbon protein
LTELIRFTENKYEGLELTLSEWDRQVRGHIADINKVKDQMQEVENELRSIKNADTKVFGEEIATLKGKQEAYRKNYRQSKDIMIKGGGNIVKQIETMSSNVVRDIGKAYSEAGQKVGSSRQDPSSGKMPVTLRYTVKESGNGCVSYLVYVNEMLAWYQNEIREIKKLIDEWNPRVDGLVREDAQLRSQAEPIESRISELGSNAKQNKTEISNLKKQLAGIEKSRKQLESRMEDDAKELSATVKKMSQTSQESVKERFADIAENITYSFSEKLSL